MKIKHEFNLFGKIWQIWATALLISKHRKNSYKLLIKNDILKLILQILTQRFNKQYIWCKRLVFSTIFKTKRVNKYWKKVIVGRIIITIARGILVECCACHTKAIYTHEWNDLMLPMLVKAIFIEVPGYMFSVSRVPFKVYMSFEMFRVLG